MISSSEFNYVRVEDNSLEKNARDDLKKPQYRRWREKVLDFIDQRGIAYEGSLLNLGRTPEYRTRIKYVLELMVAIDELKSERRKVAGSRVIAYSLADVDYGNISPALFSRQTNMRP